MITPAHAFFNWAILRKWLRPWWVVDTNVDYKTLSRTTILPWRVWDNHGDPYVF